MNPILDTEREKLLALLHKKRRQPNVDQTGPVPLQRGSMLLLSEVQERLWMQHALGGGAAWTMAGALELTGPLDVVALQSALNALVARHEPLRTRFILGEDEVPQQLIDEPLAADLRVQVTDRSQASVLVRSHEEEEFDLRTGPLFRVLLVKISADEHVLSLAMHHIVADGWSMDVLVRDIREFYRAEVEGGVPKLMPLGIQYADWAVWKRGLDLSRSVAYWKDALAGPPAPLALTRRAATGGRGQAQQIWRTMPKPLAEALTLYARARRASLFVVFMAGWALVSYRRTRAGDLLLGTTVAGRQRTELEPMIGFFINIVALRLRLGGNPTGEELMLRVRQAVLDGFEHQDVPFERLLSEVEGLRQPHGGSPVPVMVRHQNYRKADARHWAGNLEGCTFAVERNVQSTSDLDLEYVGEGAELEVTATYDSAKFDASEVGALLDEVEILLSRLVAEPDARLSQLIELTDGERQVLAVLRGPVRMSKPESITRLFATQVRLRPEAVACRHSGHSLTYNELDRRSDRVAQALAMRGVSAGERVALYLQRGGDLLTALLGVWKARGVYVPIDPSYPDTYASRIIAEVEPRVIVMQSTQQVSFELGGVELLALNALWAEQEYKPWQQRPEPASEALAYIAYTSGSTDVSKGVAVEHGQLLNCLLNLWETQPFVLGELVAQKTGTSFVVHLKEMLCGLLMGVEQWIASDLLVRDTPAFAQALSANGVTRLNLVPTHLAALLDYAEHLSSLKRVVVAGEPLSELLRVRFTKMLPDAELYNNYGTTETNDLCYCLAAGRDVLPMAGEMVPMGTPIANTQLHILDEYFYPVPPGVAGELYVEGVAVGVCGYWRRSELTHERWIQNPFNGGASLLFRTGDLGRLRLGPGSVWQLEYLGRADFQIKLRGQKVDPLGVEQVLEQHPELARAAVRGWNSGTSDAFLAAYYVPELQVDVDRGAEAVESMQAGPDHNQLQRWMADRLPAYMVPAVYILLQELPLMPNGKLDRRALPEPGDDVYNNRTFEAPQGLLEQKLAAIWSELLRMKQIGRHDNFFALKGNSLKAMQMKIRLGEQLGYEVSLNEIFENPVLSKLAAVLDTSGSSVSQDRPIALQRDRTFPLSHFQQAYWYVHQRARDNPHNVGSVFVLDGPLSLSAFESALNDLVERHEILRTRFVVEHGKTEPQQAIDAAFRTPLTVRDVYPDELQQCIREHASQIFDLEQGQLFNVLLLRLGSEQHIVSCVLHHILADAWSLSVLARDLRSLYSTRLHGRPSGLPSLKIQYADYAAWERGRDLSEHKEYWTSALANYQGSFDQSIHTSQNSAGPKRAAKLTRSIPMALAAAIGEFRKKQQTSLFMVLLGGLALLAYRETRQFDVCFATTSSGREYSELELLIGSFVNLLPLRFAVSREITAEELLSEVRRVVLLGIAHQALPFPYRIVSSRENGPGNSSRFPRVWVRHQNYPEAEIETWADGLQARSFSVGAEYSVNSLADLDLQFYGDTDGLSVVALFAIDHFDEDQVNSLLLELEGILARMIEMPQATLHQLLESISEGKKKNDFSYLI